MTGRASPDAASAVTGPASVGPSLIDGGVRLAGLWLWLWLTLSAALLGAAGSIAALVASEDIYGDETTVLADAAAAQDIVNLVLVAPLLVALGVMAWRGSLRAYLALLGCLAFTAYNYVIYAFSVRFGPLFLVWVVVLGLSIFALIGGLASADASAVKARFAGGGMLLPAWFLMVVATLFALLWLSEIVPDLLAGGPSRSASDWNVPTNPVHVLDLAFFLPAVFTSGVLLLHRHPFGYITAAGQLVWLALTSVPILVSPLIASARGHDAGWAVIVPIGTVLIATLTVLGQLMQRVTADPTPRQDRPRR